jgi:Lipase (class 3)
LALFLNKSLLDSWICGPNNIFKALTTTVMRLSKICLFLLILLLLNQKSQAQTALLQPGFDKNEYLELLKITARQVDTPWNKVQTPASEKFKMVYRSPTMGLDNRWDLWVADNGIAVISLRGTTLKMESWVENFYAAMVPASGSIRISQTDTFHYQLAKNPRAAVHTGWLIGMAFLSKDILPKIDSLYKNGCSNMIILGHSQGGGIAYLLSAHLANLQEQNLISSKIQFKTYCSAAPKPGNLFFAYEYERGMMSGWGFNVVNSADWVPETPLTVQALSDFNQTNPFTNAKPIIRKQPFPKNWALKYAYNQLNNASIKANKRYEKYLGKTVAGFVAKSLPGFEAPAYAKGFNYVRVGPTIVLLANDSYYQSFPDNPEKIFVHHFIDAYWFLANQLPEKN